MLRISSQSLDLVERVIPFVSVLLSIAAVMFIGSLEIAIACFTAMLGIYVWRKYDSRILIGTAANMMLASGGLVVGGIVGYASQVFVWSYFFLITGVLGLFIAYLREEA